MLRKIGLLLLLVIFSVSLIQAQEPTCSEDTLQTLIDQLESQVTALNDSDQILESLAELRSSAALAQAICSGLAFESDGPALLGPLTLEDGIYWTNLITEGDALVRVLPLAGQCQTAVDGILFSVSAGQADNGAAAALQAERCQVLIEVSVTTAPWELSLGKVGAPEDFALQPSTLEPTDTVTTLSIGQGYGYAQDFWQVYFTDPSGDSDAATYSDGIDVALEAAIDGVQETLDIAAFEMNNLIIEQAILRAYGRGVQVRVVTDNEHGLEDEKDLSMHNFIEAGIPVVDDDRSGLMHNKFMILDGTVVWTGSWNYTINGTYRNNNNALVLRSPRAVSAYQQEFDEMFNGRRFGKTSPTGNSATYIEGDTPIGIFFASEDDVMDQIVQTVSEAEHEIRFMAFSFTDDDLGQAMLAEYQAGTEIQGIFETTGSETQYSELTPLLCAGIDVRQDGNPYVLHHKVIIVDDHTVITGSFNFSSSAANSNDENLVIISNEAIAKLYIEEFERQWAIARVPDDIPCG